MHDILTSALAGNIADRRKRREPSHPTLQGHWRIGSLRIAAALAIVAGIAVALAGSPTGGAEMLLAATF